MVRLSGSISTYLQAAWTLDAPVAVANIRWNEDWFNTKYLMAPQITVSDMDNPHFEGFNTAGSLDINYRPLYNINVWVPVKRGNIGTQESQNAQDMRLEVARICREFQALSPAGGSLSPFNVIRPDGAGRPLHELDSTPRLLRYEITLITTRWNE